MIHEFKLGSLKMQAMRTKEAPGLGGNTSVCDVARSMCGPRLRGGMDHGGLMKKNKSQGSAAARSVDVARSTCGRKIRARDTYCVLRARDALNTSSLLPLLLLPPLPPLSLLLLLLLLFLPSSLCSLPSPLSLLRVSCRRVGEMGLGGGVRESGTDSRTVARAYSSDHRLPGRSAAV